MVVATVVFGLFGAVSSVAAAPYAAIVVDARDGKVLHSRSADRKLHPASLTKMMTLYLTFEAVRRGRLGLDQKVRISKRAARQVPSKIGLRAGSRVSIRDLIRATAVKSANDAAVALAEAVSGDEPQFAKAMTKRARELGMRNTTFRNASGLTAKGQLSTARDMATLGRALFYDFPQYYNLFGRRKTTAMGKTIHSTNRRLLRNYEGADGIKTGYTNAAGYNLVSSAQRGKKRVIAVVFGGRTSRSRNARVAELLDMGFARAPTNVASKRPAKIVTHLSPTPVRRPGSAPAAPPSAKPSLLAQVSDAIVPAAAASEAPRFHTAQAPFAAPAPKRRPGSEPGATVATLAPTPSAPPQSGGWAVQLGVFAREETAIAEL
ncbi:MAG: D-alanyl-D-alanine carboxypeptidase family protein, partial [Pseudomonadota bacterium]